MNREYSEGTICWPDAVQRMLLTVALCPDDAVAEHWRRWKEQVPFDDIDYPSLQLVPQVYRRLKQLVPDEPLLPRMRGIYKKMWFSNQLLFNRVMPVLDILDRYAIPWMALKGVGMLRYYPGDAGLRPMHDFDVLVRPQDAQRVIDVMFDAGWEPEPLNGREAIRLLVPQRHNRNFIHDGASLDVHWHALHQDLAPDSDRELWESVETARLVDREIPVAAPAEQLFVMCVHGVRWEDTAKLLWVVDAAMLLGSTGHNIDWSRFLAMARRRRMMAVVQAGLGFLIREMGIALPEPVQREVASYRAPLMERLELGALTIHPARRNRWQRRARDYLLYFRMQGDRASAPRALASWLTSGGSLHGKLLQNAVGYSWTVKRLLGRLMPGLLLGTPAPAVQVPRLENGQRVEFTPQGCGRDLAVQGWSGSEARHTWAESREARLLLDCPEPLHGHQVLTFMTGAYVPARVGRVVADLLVNGVPVQRWAWSRETAGGVRRRVVVPAALWSRRRPADLVLQARRLHSPADEEGAVDTRQLGPCLYWIRTGEAAVVEPGTLVRFSVDGNGQDYLGNGWYEPEASGTWTRGRRAVLYIPLHKAPDSGFELQLELTPFLPTRGMQRVSVLLNGRRLRQLEFTSNTMCRVGIPVAPGLVVPGGVLELQLAIARPAAPAEQGSSGDRRRLGVMLCALQVTPLVTRPVRA